MNIREGLFRMAGAIDRRKAKNKKEPIDEWSRNGSFLNKPSRGWIHNDQLLLTDGICYGVRYIGRIIVKESMKSLDFETRTTVAREAINVIADAAGLKTCSKKRKVDKKIMKMLADLPDMHFAGSNVNLNISTEKIDLISMESGEEIASHYMHSISFASGGDAESLDFVAYIGKDELGIRTCQVLECGGGLAEDVVKTIGQTFELRFKQHLQNRPAVVEVDNCRTNESFEKERWGEDQEYYNDHPGAMAPSPSRPPIPPIPQYSSPTSLPVSQYDSVRLKSENGYSDISDDIETKLLSDGKVYDNSHTEETLINNGALQDECIYDHRNGLKEEVDVAGATGGTQYDNTKIMKEKDVFDMSPFSGELPTNAPSDQNRESTWNDSGITTPIFEEWFHGNLSRKDAEKLLPSNGDFLVRESSKKTGQYVLSGKQDGVIKHLLLVDPEGVVRTKDFIFDSVGHLVQYHRQNNLPIVTQESELLLKRPVKTSITSC